MMFSGNELKKLRIAAGLTQEELGAACVPPMLASAIGRYESGGAMPRRGTIVRLAKALNVDPSALDSLSPYEQLKVEQAKEDFIDSEIKETLDMLNIDGKKKVAAYAQDLSKIPEYKK